jgi:filamentous hemagglutinin family protein
MNSSLNHVYRIIWNAALGLWQVASEATRGRGKTGSSQQARKARRALAAATAMTLASPAAWAVLPTGGNVVAGSATISQAGSALNITQASDKAAINWQSFSIGQGNSVNFVQPSATSVALNRVLGNDVSVIQGAINANGQVFLVNQNGVLFTPTAQVNVGGIVASTQNISTADFMAGKYEFSGNSTATVENQGSITAANGGVVALVAAKVINSGTITAPQGTVGLAAGNTVLLDLGGPVKIQVTEGALNAAIEQSGGIRADGGTIYLTAKAAGNLAASVINHSGVTRALTMASLTGEPQGQTGSIALSADQINHTGTLDVSGLLAGQHGGDILAQGKHYSDSGTTLADGAAQGGNIDVRATNITQTQGAKVSASSSDGQGGRIEMIGDLGNGRAEFAGQILATGRRRGGFIETSGATVKLNENTLRINAGSSEGKAGIWVIDPKDYTIAASGGDVTGAFLSQQLKNQSVQIYSTQGASEGNGDIHVNDTITATSGQSLGLYAERDININKSISINLLLLAAKGSVNVNDVVTVNEYLELNYGANSNFSANTSVRPSDTAALNMKMTRDGFVGKINLGVSANEVSINGNAQTILRNATDLAGVANGLSGQYVLASDISLAAVADWTSIGAGLGFKGALEGLGHLASGLSITSNRTQAGLFSSVAGGTLTNLGVGGSIAFANQSVGTRTAGGLAGSVSGASTLRNLYSTVAVDVSSGSNAILGGLLGSIAGTSTLTNAYATGSVKASGVSTSHNAGGLIGQIGSGTSQVSRVYAAGSVSASGSGVGNAGGLIGIVSSSFTLSQAYATGSVQANGSTSSNAGGLVSVLSSGTMVVSIDNVFATGAVSGSGSFQQFGGLLGNSGTVSGAGAKTLSNAYWNSATTGQALAVASNSAAQPTQINVVNAAIGTAGTAFPNLDPTVWNIVNGTPVLKVFQTIAAPAITPVTYTLQTLTGTYTYKAEQYNLADLWATSTIFTDCTVCTSWTAGTDYNFTYSGNVVTGFTNANTYSGIGINVLKPGFSLATTGNTTGSLTIDQAKISGVTGITAESKTYDGLRAATLNTSAAQFTGLLAADAGKVTVASAIGTFNTKDATQNKIVNISDITLGGVGAVNYRLDNASTTSFTLPGSSQPMIITLPNTANTATTTATITPKALNITDGSVVTRDYDGTRTATVNVGVLSGLVELEGQAETLGITTAVGTFDDADAGAKKDVAVKYTLTNGSGATGGLASNYTLADGSLKGTITPRALTVALQGTTANPLTKVYNGNANLALNSANFLLGNFVGEQGTGAALNGITSGIFNDANVLQANTVTANLTGSTLALAQGVKASNYSLSTEPVAAAGTITAKAVQVTGLMAQNKEYNGLLNATITGTATVASDAFIQGDDVSVSGNVTGGVFTSKDAGTDIAVSVTGLSLTGNEASNYQVTAPGLKANITPKEVIVDGIVASGKTYDGNDTAELTNQGAVATGIVGETLTVATTGSFNDKNAGARKVNTTTTIATNGTTLASNYTLSNATNAVDATISQKAVSVAGIAAKGKTYDGNDTAELTNQGTVATGIVGETLTVATTGSFNDKNAGDRKVNTTTTIATNGTTLASNYSLSNATNAVDATISQKGLTIAATATNKVYDGKSTATATLSTGDLVNNDKVTLNQTAANFINANQENDKNVGQDKTVRVTGLSLSGDDAANYKLTNGEESADTTANITARAVQVSGLTAQNKIYDGNTTATIDVSKAQFANVVADDVGELAVASVTGAFADKNVGSAKTVSITGITLGGSAAKNYELTNASTSPVMANTATTATAQANITRLSSVMWVGGATGNWFDAANWAGGAVPDLANVASVVLPANVKVTFNGAMDAVMIDTLGASGALDMASGTLNVGTGGITLAGFNQTGGTLNTTGNLSVTQASGPIQVGALTVGGTLALKTQGAISQLANTALTVTGATSVDAGTNAVTLANAGNDFSSVGVIGSAVSITDKNALVLGAIDASTLTVKAGGAVTQSAAAKVLSTTSVDAGTHDVTLDNAENSFLTVAAIGGDVVVVDKDTLNLAAIQANNLSVTSGGDIFQNGAAKVTGAASFSAGTSDINLTNTANDFNTLSLTGGRLSVMDVNALQLGTTSGTVFVVSAGGDITQSANSTITASSASQLNAGTNAVTLTNAGNDFNGVEITAGDASITDKNALVLRTIKTNTLTVKAGGDVTQILPATVMGATSIDAGTNAVTLTNTNNDFNSIAVTGGAVSINDKNAVALDAIKATSLTVTAGGEVTQVADKTLEVTGATSVDAGTNAVTLANSGNDFGSIGVTAGAASITDKNTVVLDALRAFSLTVKAGGDVTQSAAALVLGETSVDATGFDVRLTNAGNDFNTVTAKAKDLSIVDANGGVVLGDVVATGNTRVTSTGGSITQSENATMSVAGTTNVDAGKDNVSLGAAGNSFTGAVTATGSDVTLVSKGALTAAITAAEATLSAAGNLAVSGTTTKGLTTTTTGVNSTTTFGNTTVEGDLAVTSTGKVAQAADTVLAVAGKTAINAGANAVDLSNSGNAFSSIAVTGGAVSLTDKDSVALDAINATSLAVKAGGAVTQNAAALVTGATSVDATGFDVTLTNSGNDFGTVSAKARDLSIVDATGGVVLGDVVTTGNLSVMTAGGGDITQTLDGSLLITGTSAFDSSNNITLPNLSNNFVGAVTLIGNEVTLGSDALIRIEKRDVRSLKLEGGPNANTGTRDAAIANAQAQTLEPKLDLQIEREALEERSGDIAPFIIAANQPRAQGPAQLIVVNGGIRLPAGQQEEN